MPELNRIEKKFTDLQNKKEKGLITFITAGDPNLNKTVELVLGMEKAGADVIELGVPFSDPQADGPVIQKASLRAIKGGTSLYKIIECVKIIREQSEVPIVLMTYYNPVYFMGLENFSKMAHEAGVDGLIIPDLPYEESAEIQDILNLNNIALIPLVAPTTPLQRMKEITQKARGFIYCVSLTGVTGTREKVSTDIGTFMADVHKATHVPVAIGFGISNPEQAKYMADFSDAVIVGSAIVRTIEEQGDSQGTIDAVSKQVRALKEAVAG